MPTKEVFQCGNIGVIHDEPGHDLPDNAFTDAKNMQFVKGAAAERVFGHEGVFDTVQVPPLWTIQALNTSGEYLWLYAGTAKAYSYNGIGHAEITNAGGDYSALAGRGWTGGRFGRSVFLNNGIDPPQMWNPVSHSQLLQDLTDWPASTLCGALRSFKTYLIAMDMTESGVHYGTRIRWSDNGAGLAIPDDWSVGDPTSDGGEKELDDTPGDIIDCLPLGDLNVIYKTDSTIIQQLITGNDVFSFRTRFEESGILAHSCVGKWRNQHLVVTPDDIIVHNLQSIDSVVDKKWRNWFFANLDSDNYQRTFVVILPKRKEAWVCFPMSGSSYANMALVIDMTTGAIGSKELPDIRYATVGIVDPSPVETWDSDSNPWDTDNTFWDERVVDPEQLNILSCGAADTELYFHNPQVNTFDGNAAESYVERMGLRLDDPERPDTKYRYKLIQRVRLHLEAPSGTNFTVSVPVQEFHNGSVSWKDQSFIAGQDHTIDFGVNTLLGGLRVKTQSSVNWKLFDYVIDYKFGAKAVL